jgi:hypothetical protein
VKTQLKRLICLVLAIALTACASAPTHRLNPDNPTQNERERKALSGSLSPGDKIVVTLKSRETLTLTFSELSDAGLLGWPEGDHAFATGESGKVTLPWEEITAVELTSQGEKNLNAGKILLGVLLLIGISALIVSVTNNGNQFSFEGF